MEKTLILNANLIVNLLILNFNYNIIKDTELKDTLRYEGATSESYVEEELLREDINKLLSELTPKEQEIITLCFGLIN